MSISRDGARPQCLGRARIRRPQKHLDGLGALRESRQRLTRYSG